MHRWQKYLLTRTPGSPSSGWIAFRIRNEQNLEHSLWFMRLSYLRYPLKAATDLHKLFEQETGQLHLSSQLKSLLEPFVPKIANHVSRADVEGSVTSNLQLKRS